MEEEALKYSSLNITNYDYQQKIKCLNEIRRSERIDEDEIFKFN